jgi:hypothetical protein
MLEDVPFFKNILNCLIIYILKTILFKLQIQLLNFFLKYMFYKIKK